MARTRGEQLSGPNEDSSWKNEDRRCIRCAGHPSTSSDTLRAPGPAHTTLRSGPETGTHLPGACRLITMAQKVLCMLSSSPRTRLRRVARPPNLPITTCSRLHYCRHVSCPESHFRLRPSSIPKLHPRPLPYVYRSYDQLAS